MEYDEGNVISGKIKKPLRMVVGDIALLIYALFCFGLFFTDYSFVGRRVSINNLLLPVLGLFLLVFLRWYTDKANFKNSLICRLFLKLQRIDDRDLIILLVAFTFLLFSLISVIRHLSLNTGAFDLAIFDQGIWNASQGNSLFCTVKWSQGGNLLGDHFQPILFFIALFYKICPHVLVLLILQSFLLASGIIPLYLIAKSVLKDRFLIFCFLVCYILSKPLRGVAFSDFHTESFIVPCLFLAYYFLIKRNNALLWLSLVILLLCKEDTTFLTAGFGLFALMIQKRRRLGVFLVLSSIFLWWWETAILIPFYSPSHAYEYLGKMPFGGTYSDNFRFCFYHPLLFIKFILTKAKINYMLGLFGPLCFLSLLSPPHLVLVFIPLFKNLLAGGKIANLIPFIGINEHYVAGIVPFIFIAAIYGSHGLLGKLRIKNGNIVVGAFLIFFTLLFFGKTDGCRMAGFLKDMRSNHTLEKIKSLDMIPSQASVTASADLCSHLSHRKYLYIWHPIWDLRILSQYIVIDKIDLEKSSHANAYSTNESSHFDGYLKDAKNYGYKIVFTSEDNNLLILFNANINK